MLIRIEVEVFYTYFYCGFVIILDLNFVKVSGSLRDIGTTQYANELI